tara:strand:- start:545 stop:667 length:123 start_codon:yes stop_codon:yes gene_type:complete
VIFRERYVLFVGYLSHGEKNGREIGMMSFTAQISADPIND